MNLLNLVGIQDAEAQNVPTVNQTATTQAPAAPAPAAHPQQGAGFMSMVWVIAAMIIIFYFLLIRPQSKRAKEYRKLMDSLAKGDEVVTTGGIAGKIVKLDENYAILTVTEGTDLTFEKSAIARVLPKGTLKTIEK